MTPTKRRAYAALAASTALLTLAACGDSDAAENDASSSKTPSATSAAPSEPAASDSGASGAFTEETLGLIEDRLGSWATRNR